MFDAIIISDLHLGSDNCQAKTINYFLEQIISEEILTNLLILNGDVFDSFDFRRLKKNHWKVLSNIRHLSDKIEIVYIQGNHDGPADILSHLIGVDVRDKYLMNSAGKFIYITHGHQYDKFVNKHPFLTLIADFIYNILQKIDPSHEVARMVKSSSKTFMRNIVKVRKESLIDAKSHLCEIAICSHTHHKEKTINDEMAYYNTGCWTESPCSYVTIKNGVVELKEFDT